MTIAIPPSASQYVATQVGRLGLKQSGTNGQALSTDGADGGLRGDSVTISSEARTKLEQDPIGTSPWEIDYGYRNGTSILKNGNSQTVTIKDNHLTVQEFSGNDIVREESAEITSSGLTRDITHYDKRGSIVSAMHSSLQSGSGTGSSGTSATLTRSAQWFENGILVRDMQDSMELKAKYDDLADLDPNLLPKADNIEVRMKTMTRNNAAANYNATITEYKDGTLSRQATISRGIHSLSISMTAFDSVGRVSFEAVYTEKTDIGFDHKRHLSMSTYEDGKLTSRSEGDTVNKEIPVTVEHNQPQSLDAQGIQQEEYAWQTPLTAQDMLTRCFQESSANPGNHQTPTLNEANGKGLTPIPGEGRAKGPYEVEWNNETYVNGQLVAKQRHTEQAVENPLASRDPFAPGKGLTEDDNPPVLLRSSHELELYKDGVQSMSMHSEMREEIKINDRDVAMVKTHVKVGSGPELSINDPWVLRAGRLDTVDKDSHAASQGFAKGLGQYLTAVHGMINGRQVQGDQVNGL